MVNQIKRIMKELSIEEKAKAYDKALERAIKLKEDPQSVFYEYSPNEGDTICDYIFPELKESEDDKIKACIEMCLTDIDEQRFADFNTNLKECHDWLEKKGEQKPQDKSALEAIKEEKVDNANKVEPKQEKLTEFEKAVKQVMEEAIECGDTHNLKADADMLLSLVQKYVDNGEHKFLTVERAKRIIK